MLDLYYFLSVKKRSCRNATISVYSQAKRVLGVGNKPSYLHHSIMGRRPWLPTNQNSGIAPYNDSLTEKSLSHPEKSVLSKGLNLVRISEKPTNFQIARRLKCLCGVQLKAFFHDKEDDSNTSNKNTSKHFRFKSLNGLLQRASSHL